MHLKGEEQCWSLLVEEELIWYYTSEAMLSTDKFANFGESEIPFEKQTFQPTSFKQRRNIKRALAIEQKP